MKFAAIDVGSNAIRLLLARVIDDGQEPFVKKESLIRIPLRLGDDAFVRKQISVEKAAALVNSMKGFSYLMRAYRPIGYRACATSAMREAGNGHRLAARVQRESGIMLEVIDGDEEAGIIFDNHVERRLPGDGSCMYIDVGGGSTELTIFVNGERGAWRSFDIGTVRIIEDLVSDKQWLDMERWVKSQTTAKNPLVAVGSGGNINKLFRLARRKEGKPLAIRKLAALRHELSPLSFEQRIRKFGLRPDRADVIVPALRIYLAVMNWARIEKIFVPQVGLADGMVHQLYQEHVATLHAAD